MAQSESVDAAYDGEEQIREYEYDAYGNELIWAGYLYNIIFAYSNYVSCITGSS